jgi:hypothetical protein
MQSSDGLIDILSDSDERLYEIDVLQAIDREFGITRDVDDMIRFSLSIDKLIVDELAYAMRDVVGGSEKARSATVMHGMSIINKKYRDMLTMINDMQVKLMDCDIPEVRDLASNANVSIYGEMMSSRRTKVSIPKNVAGAVSDLASSLFLKDTSVFYRMCMMYSLYTRDGIHAENKRQLEFRMDQFIQHLRKQCVLFSSLNGFVDNGELSIFTGLKLHGV